MLRKRMFQSLIGRLKTTMHKIDDADLVLFQSLIGRLKTHFDDAVVALFVEFQSLIGRLKTCLLLKTHRFPK